MKSQELIVWGTGWRPRFLPLIILAGNNLNPAASFDENGLTVKVFRSTLLPWQSISSVVVKKGIMTTYCVVVSGDSAFILHFREREDLGVLVRELRARGISVEVSPSIERDL